MRITRVLAAVWMATSFVVTGCGPSNESAGGAVTPAPAVSAKLPFGFLNTPTEGQVVNPLTPGWFATGWALADSGIAQISVIFDDGQKGYVKVGFPFPGVKEQFPNLPDADKAGYMFAIPKMTPGPHSLTVTVKAKDSGTTQIQRHFSIAS